MKIKATIYVDEELLKDIYTDVENFIFKECFEDAMDILDQYGMRLGSWAIESEED